MLLSVGITFNISDAKAALVSAYNSIPARVLGRVVVYRFICEKHETDIFGVSHEAILYEVLY
jgi:hypothetical protein